jgi:competence protein ComEC
MTGQDQGSATPDVEMYFLDVGQGDATLLIDYNYGVAAVIDCHRAGETPIEELLAKSRAQLVAVFISHFHADHFDAIPNIAGRRRSAAVYCNRSVTHLGSRDQRSQVRAFKRWLADEQTKGRPRDTLSDGSTGQIGLIEWECLAPTTQLLDSAEGYAAENRTSIVLRVSLPSLSVLLGADADALVWQHLLAKHRFPVDILRVPHHGGPLLPQGIVNISDVIEVYRPKVRIVSVGSVNRYGHATPEWLGVPSPTSGRVLCTEVTAACHGAHFDGPKPCAGTVGVQWWRDGNWRLIPDRAVHLPVVAGWDHPQCILRDEQS